MIGGSLGRALITRKLAAVVVGVDPLPGVLKKAVELGAVSCGAPSLAAGVDGADLIVLATPAGTTLSLLSELGRLLGEKKVLISDVCSTKDRVVSHAAAVLPPGSSFIGGHPMAGSEKEGVAALDEALFENALYILTAEPGGDRLALETMEKVVKGLGAVPMVMEAKRHDLVVAAISHLPHMAASALVQAAAGLSEYKHELLALAAGGFRDTTRVAMGNPEMWKDICLSNSENIIAMIDGFSKELAGLRALIAGCDESALLAYFQQAREFRRLVPYRGKGILPSVYNLHVFVADRPGIIGEVAGRLGVAGINIAEIELLKVREEEGGPLRLGFLSASGRSEALTMLRQEGFRIQIPDD
jgi:prephenate dehydrogenase